MTSGGKQLTTPPENLKEAIDWVLRVSGRDSDKENEEGKKAIKGLAEELTASMRKKPYEENDDVKKILTEIMYDANISPTGPVIRLAYALQKFIRYERDRNKQQWMIGDKGIVQKDSSYNFTYGSSKWLDDVYNADNDGSKRRKGVQCFFTAIEKIYEGLTELFFNCKTEWSSQSLSGSGHSDTLNQFMTTNGFSGTQLNTSMTGDKIATQAFQGLNEFSEAYGAAGSNPSLDTFRSQLEQNASTSPSTFPLSALYILATYVYVQSSSPATPCFAGYSGLTALAGGAYGLNVGGLDIPSINLPTSLFDCPSNQKEAIDWILRVTGRDGGQQSVNGSEQLAAAVGKLLEGVKSFSSELEEKFEEIKVALKSDPPNGNIDALANGLRGFRDGITHTSNYKSAYDFSSQWNTVGSNSGVPNGHDYCAKIFLGCVPMIFSALSYLYWRCSQEGNGEWKEITLGGSNGRDLSYFMTSVGYKFTELNGWKKGSDIFTNPQSHFADLETANKKSYSHFVGELKLQSKEKLISSNTDHSLSVLHYIGSLYFNGRQRQKTKEAKVSPTTIREMLYFLGALPFSPLYDSLSEHISSLFKTLSPKSSDDDAELLLPVADSGSPNKGDYLNPDKMRDYLTNTCFFSSFILGRIQGHAADSENEPWLHSLYCNSMNLTYPAGASLFHALSNYAYALQFQLSFLHQQCMSGSVNCGWLQCKYGKNVPTHTASHICPTPCKNSSAADCRHDGRAANSTGCKHGDNCGKNSNSPLQAFLTDKLKGFCLPQQSISDSTNHLDNHPPGSMCHVPMGFNPNDLKPSGTGQYIFYTIEPFCRSPVSPLRQLSEKLFCLTKRTPRTLGAIFGFYLQLVGQLFNTRMTTFDLAGSILVHLDSSIRRNTLPSDAASALTAINKNLAGDNAPPQHPSGHTLSLLSLYNDFPFWFQLFMVPDSVALPLTPFDLRQHCHNKKDNGSTIEHISPAGKESCVHSTSEPGDLWSVCYPIYDAQKYPNCKDGNCGGYLSSLTQSTGATYAPKFALTYLSWVLYLADDLQSGLHELLSEFTHIDCKHSGCNTKSSVTCQCKPGQHGISSGTTCSCNSIVQCGGVLPLLYRNGFQFYDAHSLNGWMYDTSSNAWKGNQPTKRTCANFSQQLSNVLAEGAPLHNLLLAIDEFLYYVRFRFMSMVSSFWLSSLLILLYFIFYGIDVLHFKSHAHFPSSHTMPPIGLLTTGKTPALTKLTYYIP
ncbi:variant erythrocyte surface antigen-1 family protein [Babesia caballi]|uniref:Variant erythrocyte surface antigen-1 family protein n=1 Tax=Babesia caballi TaxID=5871 RepID=A0AAV4LP72_BABCB|nr:variant erythrocyte surface antigen-1 family protein [Babesia caballi]